MVIWREAVAESGSVYYYNTSDKRTQWEPPPKYLSLEEQERQQIGNEDVLMVADPVHQQVC